jgi:hypothetical protein
MGEMAVFVSSGGCKLEMSFHACWLYLKIILIGRSFYILFLSLKNTAFRLFPVSILNNKFSGQKLSSL